MSASAGLKAISFMTCAIATGITTVAFTTFTILAIYYTIVTGQFSLWWIGTFVTAPILGFMSWYTTRLYRGKD